MDWEAIGIGLLVGAILFAVGVFFMWISGPPAGYTEVGKDIAYKCDGQTILWYNMKEHEPMLPTHNDGRCHA